MNGLVTPHWDSISPYFSVPEIFRDSFGDFRSPLLQKNGTKVSSPEAWITRRKEILNDWHSLMGPWPDLIGQQTLEIISTKQREDFTQYQVRFFWMPGAQTEGYLLVPPGKDLRPAVISVYY